MTVELDEEDITEDIRIPSKICGMLIGGGGERVKQLMAETGAEVWVDWDKESHMEAGVSTVHLKGTRYAVEWAKEEIDRVQQLFERKAAISASSCPLSARDSCSAKAAPT